MKILMKFIRFFTDVTAWLRSLGVYQWDFSYPNKEIIEKDISSNSALLVKIDGQIAATISINKVAR